MPTPAHGISDPAPADSISMDSIPVETSWGLLLTPPEPQKPLPPAPETGLSWSVLLLLAPCLIIALKMRTSPGFVRSLSKDLIAVSDRTSIFDATVRESSMLFFLCLEAVIAGGILLATALTPLSPPPPAWLGFAPGPLARQLFGIAFVAGYVVFLWSAYNIVGRVFQTSQQTRLWVRGFSASFALAGLAWMPCALLAIAKPEWNHATILIAIIVFIFAKISFIWKGFRIFFSKASSGILFFYYLCSLEVVPVILTLAAAIHGC